MKNPCSFNTSAQTARNGLRKVTSIGLALVCMLVGHASGQVFTNGATGQMLSLIPGRVTREIKTNYNQIGMLNLFTDSSYSVLAPQLYTNTIAVIPFDGVTYTQMLSSFPGPSSTNFCDLKFEEQSVPPVPPRGTPGGPTPQFLQMPVLPKPIK